MPLLDEQDKDKMQQSTQTVQPVQPMQPVQPAQPAQQPQSAVPQARPTVAGQQTQRPSRGTGFMGIKRVLGASQGSRVGQGVTSRLQSAGEAARTGLATAAQDFAKKAGEESDRLKRQKLEAQSTLKGIKEAQGEVADPTAEQQAAFQSIASGQVQSPMGLEQAEDLRIKAMQAGRLGALAGTQSGRQELLRQQFAQRGGYGAKQSALDALILGKTAGRELAQAKSGLAGIGREVSSEEQAAAQRARGLKEEATGLSREVLGDLGLYAGEIGQGVSKRVDLAKAQQQTDYDKALEALKTGTITKELAEKLGITEDTYFQDLSEEQIKDFVKKSIELNAANVISKEEASKLDALSKLSGSLGSGILQPTLSPFKGKEEEAGKYDPMKAVGLGEYLEKGEEQRDSLLKGISERETPVKNTVDAAQSHYDSIKQQLDALNPFQWQAYAGPVPPSSNPLGIYFDQRSGTYRSSALDKAQDNLNMAKSSYGWLQRILSPEKEKAGRKFKITE